jgi:photosystem II stability/assembly factor-like uncharacterized protein
VDSIDRSGNQILLALTGTGALQSADSGATWTRCGDPQLSTTWYGLAFDPATPNIALSATAAGLFRSTDGCVSWAPVRDGLPAATASLVLFHPKRPREAYLAQGGKVFRSTDGGQRWLSLEDDANGNSGPSSLFVLPEVPDRLFALFPRRGVFSTSVPGTTQGTPEPTNSNRTQSGGPVAGSSDFVRNTVTNKSNTTKEKTVQ